ncbi:efflux RND transporter periplasmic adaptor subunit [Umezakia ovalisporum]|jgi:RND family efflux transporter MFP subunit|uniref:efflux RND transporter periplasmic adaptor subunit n=1 Tax=Umezakia ovalisporum TaxID=75695 RepID=UPI0006F0BE7F|nr:efflux RND transporter periplasmic adaptor subunit [Umezakia ovalisporum]MBI1242368.1 efflux RND transporter periplasmic adaptor subunit [Nostoc sp. RI_552]MDH6085488.1 efflux RND transporter periplasmic adaptor subunit [Umezakia ovalisporum TAC611]MDH6089570.1 efflux RND transporter periplasmic adaptor subunit [Umezakia ovalisporum Ak1311]CEJ46012.1 Putative RND efflux membrane fusion protein (Unch aracterized protein) [Umezakia ovalisporum]
MILEKKMPKKQAQLPSYQGSLNQVINCQLHSTSPTKQTTQTANSPLSIRVLLITYLLGIGLLTVSCTSIPKQSAQAQPQQRGQGANSNKATAVDVAIARTGLLQLQPTYTGNTTPYRTVSLRSQVEGRLLALNLGLGDKVKQGQKVGFLDDALLLKSLKQAEAELAALKSEVARAQTQVSNARAEVEKARLELIQAEADSKRQQELFQVGAIAQQTAEQTRTKAKTALQSLRAAEERVRTEQQAVAAAQGRVIAQQAVVAQFQERRSYARLISPITGVITQRITEPGNLLQPGNEVLQIADFSRIKVVVEVSELELSQIQIGQSVQVSLDAFPNESLIGRVTRISPSADAIARLIPVEIVIPNNNNKIGSGLLARVKFETQTSQRVVVSAAAIQKAANNNNSSQSREDTSGKVFLITETEGETKATARVVTLGNKADGKVEIVSGLQAGERYIARSSRPLQEGEPVVLSALSETIESTSGNIKN